MDALGSLYFLSFSRLVNKAGIRLACSGSIGYPMSSRYRRHVSFDLSYQ